MSSIASCVMRIAQYDIRYTTYENNCHEVFLEKRGKIRGR
ncbi:hypothetical protein LCGC14_1688640 [marine sediment metagenome]|uniref:Uncharacterized protein n=1 Tax=marine sediment metagenome TaxID=412755 RepID=A0A0F9I913_9ZZZZ